MPKKFLCLIFSLILLTASHTVFSNPMPGVLKEIAFDEVMALAIQTLKEIFPDLRDIKERHYADAIGEIKGVLVTLKDAGNYQDAKLRETVFREALTELNKSLERAYLLALQMAKEAKNAQKKSDRDRQIQQAQALERLYKQLAVIKRELHLAFGEKEIASHVEIEAAQNLKQINKEIVTAQRTPLPLLNDETKQGIIQAIGAVMIGVVMFLVGSLSSSD
jgi:hypothetical protein